MQEQGQANTELAVMGRSLGTAIAIWLAHKVKPSQLVLISPFCSIGSVLRSRFWLAPFSLLAGRRFFNASLAAELSTKTLIILAEKDKQIAHRDSLKLAGSLATQPVVMKIKGTNHKTVPRNEKTQLAVAAFLTKRKP